MQLKLPIRPVKIEYDLVAEGAFQTDYEVGQLHINIHTDKQSRFITLDVEVFDNDGFRADSKTVTISTGMRVEE